MRVRLIGIDLVGEEIVAACVRYFRDERHIASLIESQKVIHTSSAAYRKYLPKVHGLVQDLLMMPQEEMWLRGGLGYIFFGPVAQLQNRLDTLLGKHELPDTLARRADLKFWPGQLIPRLKQAEPGRLEQFADMVKQGAEDQGTYLGQRTGILGGDWLLAPALPLEGTPEPPRRANIGRKLMQAVLKNGGAEQLVNNLGKKPPDGPEVDVVVIAFSAGDSFGVEGAELLAEEVRASLKDPEATRVIAILGFAAYEGGERALDGRCVGRYMGLQVRKGMLDGLITRPKSPPHGDLAGVANLQHGLGFPQLLASIALASDPHVIQADNPDANQLQRDFGRRLFAAGFTRSDQVAGVEGGAGDSPMNLEGLYRAAKTNLNQWHSHGGSALTQVLGELKVIVERLPRRFPNWQPPAWVKTLCAAKNNAPPEKDGEAPPRVEQLTARKVIAYIGHNGHLNASELRKLRQDLTRDFPRARTVVYKYSIDFRDPPALLTGQEGELLPVGIPVDEGAGTEEVLAWGEVRPLLADHNQAGPEDNDRPVTEAHFALFLVDTFQMAAFDRLSEYVLHNVAVRENSGTQAWNPLEHLEIIEPVILALLARSLLSCPFDIHKDVSEPWSPPGLAETGMMQTCVKDSVLGGVDEDFSRRMKVTISNYVAGEVLNDAELATEAQVTEMTIREAASSLSEEAPSQQFTGDDLADILCGLNVICNETLEVRHVKKELIACLRAIKDAPSVKEVRRPRPTV